MATFISTIKFTEQGIQNIQQSPKRAAAFKSAAKKLGVKVTDIYWTLGSFHGVLMFDDPNDETAPQLVSITPGNNQFITAPQLLFRFSEPVHSDVTNLDLSLSINPALGMTGKISPNQQEMLVELSGLRVGETYSLTLHQAGVRDLKGNFIARGHQSTNGVIDDTVPVDQLLRRLGHFNHY